MSSNTKTFPWRETPVRHEITGRITRIIVVPGLDGREVSVPIPNELSTTEAVREIRKFTARLPEDASDAKNVLSALRKQAQPAGVQACVPGWKPARSDRLQHGAIEAFVTPAQVISFADHSYVWTGPVYGGDHIGSVKGSLLQWRLDYRSLAIRSNYLVFAIGCAFAASARVFVELPESPLFGFWGDTSTGKTTLVMTAQAVQGHPRAISSWDQTARGLEETAADHNHVLLVLNAAEKSQPKHRRTVLTRITHMVAEGESMVRSRGVSERYPALRWEGITLATSNASARQMAAELGLPWRDQDDVRYVDIPVPSRDEGGIFDRPKLGGESAKDQSRKLIRRLDASLKLSYGAPLEPWIRHLASQDPSRRLNEFTARFMQKCGSPSGMEGRIAAKFALIYAALKMANEDARLLHWPRRLPLEAVLALYERSRLARAREGDRPSCIRTFARLIGDSQLVRRVDRGTTVRARSDKDLLGVRCLHRGRQVVGVRLRSLRRLLPVDHKRAVAWLKREGLLAMGHGGRSTGQLPVKLRVGRRTLGKPRFLLIDRQKLRRALVSTRERAS